jgi:hypothetical protein
MVLVFVLGPGGHREQQTRRDCESKSRFHDWMYG